LAGEYEDIAAAMNELSSMVETQRKERHKFVQDIVSDLRAPLAMLQAGKHLINPAGEQMSESHQLQAAGAVRLGLSLLSGSLDDLNDVTDLNRLEGRLEEKIVDLPELITDVSRVLSGSGLIKQFTTSIPPMPIWTRIDARRFERVLIQVISKMAATLPQSRKLHVAISPPGTGAYNGIEITFQDGEKLEMAKSRVINTGPEQDVLRHWVSENGVGMTLAHKIVKAHGGTITASGVAGTSVQFTIRIPQQRVASGLIAPPDVSAGARMGVKTVLAAPATEMSGTPQLMT
jgi:K+-sensing histidine kinase KdpD